MKLVWDRGPKLCDVPGLTHMPASQIFFSQPPSPVRRGSDLCWNWRCDFSRLTWSSCLMKPHGPWGKVVRPWGVAAFTRKWVSEIQQLRILQTSLWPAPSQAVVPDGPALTNRESFLAWTVQSNLPLPEPQVKGDDTQNHVMGLFPTAIGCSSQSRWILCPWHTDTLNFLE